MVVDIGQKADRQRTVGEESNFLILPAEKIRCIYGRMGVIKLMKDNLTES